jgi:hypothetical protein
MEWSPNSTKQIFLICDAPGHGRDIADEWQDNYPGGSPDGLVITEQMKILAARKINFSIIKVNNSCDKMIKVLESSFNTSSMTLSVQDLSKEILIKTKEEVSKDFVKSASFIISAAVGKRKSKEKVVPLWDSKKFELD